MRPDDYELASDFAEHGEFGEAVDIVRAVVLASGADLESETRQLLDDLVAEMDGG